MSNLALLAQRCPEGQQSDRNVVERIPLSRRVARQVDAFVAVQVAGSVESELRGLLLRLGAQRVAGAL